MNKLDAPESRKRGTISPRTLLSLLVVTILLGLLAFAGFAYLNQRQKLNLAQKLEALQNQGQPGDGKETFSLAIARIKREEALAEARQATNLLDKVTSELARMETFSRQFETNASGVPSLDPALAPRLRELWQREIASAPSLPEIGGKSEDLNRIIFRLESASRTTYLPDPELLARIKAAALWATNSFEKLAALDRDLGRKFQDAKSVPSPSALSLTSPANPSPAAVKTAENALSHSEAPAGQSRTNSVPPKTNAEWLEGARLMAELKTEAAQLLDETRLESKRILAETRSEMEKILAQAKEKLLRADEASTSAPISEEPFTAPVAEPWPRAEVDPAPLPIPAPEPEGPAPILDSKMRTQLLPFTTPGNMRLPGIFRADRMPISLSQLRIFGALEPNMAGLQRLAEIASTRQDAVRPRWSTVRKTKSGWNPGTKELQKARAVQQFLIEQGSSLVKMGLLAK